VFLRFAAPLVLILPFLLWKSSIHDLFVTKSFKLQLLRAGCILMYQYAIFYYLMHASLLDATVLQNTAPLLIPVFEWLFFKMRFHIRTVISILISFAGVICILQPDKEIIGRISMAGLFAIVGQAGSQVLYGHQARSENPYSSLFYFFFLTACISGVAFLFSEEFFGGELPAGAQSIWLYGNILALGLASIFNQSLRGVAYKYAKPSTLAPFLYLSLIVSGILDWAIFQRLPNLLSVFGAVLVCAGGLIQVYYSRRKTV
jgi:drug/metabolite transporter (DMT)-like permease